MIISKEEFKVLNGFVDRSTSAFEDAKKVTRNTKSPLPDFLATIANGVIHFKCERLGLNPAIPLSDLKKSDSKDLVNAMAVTLVLIKNNLNSKFDLNSIEVSINKIKDKEIKEFISKASKNEFLAKREINNISQNNSIELRILNQNPRLLQKLKLSLLGNRKVLTNKKHVIKKFVGNPTRSL